MEKVKDTPLDVLVSLKLCECQSRNYAKITEKHIYHPRHRDLVSYTYKNGEIHIGYVTALCPEQLALSFQSRTKHCKKVNARKCKLLWKFNKIYWLEQHV